MSAAAHATRLDRGRTRTRERTRARPSRCGKRSGSGRTIEPGQRGRRRHARPVGRRFVVDLPRDQLRQRGDERGRERRQATVRAGAIRAAGRAVVVVGPVVAHVDALGVRAGGDADDEVRAAGELEGAREDQEAHRLESPPEPGRHGAHAARAAPGRRGGDSASHGQRGTMALTLRAVKRAATRAGSVGVPPAPMIYAFVGGEEDGYPRVGV